MATAAYVTQQYKELLGRDPDPGGLKHYMGYSNPAAVRAEILGSAEYRARQGGGGGGGNPSQPLFDFAATYKREQEALLNRQKQEQEGLFGQYETKLNSQEALPALYRRLQTDAGIPELGQQVQGFKDEIFRVKGLLDRLNDDVKTRNLGYYVNDALRNRIVATEGDDLRNNLGRLGTGLEPVAELLKNAQGDVNTMLQLNVEQQKKDLQPLEIRINALSDRFAREMTGFTKSREQELTAILDKLERERQLADREWELAQKLAAEERDYARAKSLAKISASSAVGYSSGGGAVTTKASTPVRSLPSVSSNILQPAYNPQRAASGLSLQGGGGGFSLQGGSLRLQ